MAVPDAHIVLVVRIAALTLCYEQSDCSLVHRMAEGSAAAVRGSSGFALNYRTLESQRWTGGTAPVER